MEITLEQARAIRRKQADLQLTAKESSSQIGISPHTYSKVATGGNVKNTVYVKVMRWLTEDL
ncbi:hypothetical protein [Streptococcus uberis]|uniref:hypothetical protein n=1 Tax=Streptococcus uberis TaxID=1349 RepID=UPI003D6C1DE8